MVAASGLAQGSTSGKSERSAIPEGEAHFSQDQLKDYYLVYTNADVRYLRTLFDSYLDKAPGHDSEFAILNKWAPEYYKSKFMVCSRDQNSFGGTLVTIMFQDKPDKIFVAWVYPVGEARNLTLRALDLGNYSDEDIKRTRVRYRAMLEDKDHAG